MTSQYLERYEIEAMRFKRDAAARAMLAALQTIRNAVTLGPLDAAAKYGPDFDLRYYEQRALSQVSAAIAQAEAVGIKSPDA